MIIDGKKIAEDIYTKTHEQVLALNRAPILTIITCDPNFETQKYLSLKEKKAMVVGIMVRIVTLTSASTTDDFISEITKATDSSDGIIVQFPLPTHIDSNQVVEHIPTSHDVDGLNPHTKVVQAPVVAACQEILTRHKIGVSEKFVTVIGSGRLVGLPAYHWFVKEGAHVSVVTRDTAGIDGYTKNADIVVCGAGVPGLLTSEMVKDGVIILDAGTSEEGGELRGDADPRCAEKAALFTPVPGGIGPITIAILLANVVHCALLKERVV